MLLFIHAPFSYAVIAAAMITLVMHSAEVASAHRRGLFLLVAACLGPLIATVVYDLGFGSNTISFVPIVFAAMLPIYIWLVFGERLVEFTPLAYETVFQNMQDPVVVIDNQCRIIGLNHGAECLLDITETDALRAPLEQVFKANATGVFAALAERHCVASRSKPRRFSTPVKGSNNAIDSICRSFTLESVTSIKVAAMSSPTGSQIIRSQRRSPPCSCSNSVSTLLNALVRLRNSSRIISISSSPMPVPAGSR